VNLRYGVPKTETVETCTAGAGSLILEFGVLSRLTNDPFYEVRIIQDKNYPLSSSVNTRFCHRIWQRRH
jgi:hypothetical protein